MTTFKINGQQIQDARINSILSDLKSKSASQAVRDVLSDNDIKTGEVLVLVNPATESGVAVVDHEDWKKVNSNFQTIGPVAFGDLALYLKEKFPDVAYQLSFETVSSGEEFKKLGFETFWDDADRLHLVAPMNFPEGDPVVFKADSKRKEPEGGFRFTTFDLHISGTTYQITFYTNYGEKLVIEMDAETKRGGYKFYEKNKLKEEKTDLFLNKDIPIPEVASPEHGGWVAPTEAISSPDEIGRILDQQNEVNPVYSLFSIRGAFRLLALGMKDADYREFAPKIGLDPNKKTEKSQAIRVNSSLTGQNDVVIKISNRAYDLNPGYFTKAYEANLGGLAPIMNLDFQNNSEGAIEIINQQVDRDTEGLIPELVDDNLVDSNTVFVLTNAVYFKGKWEKPFNQKDTNERADFNVSKSNTVKAPLMYQKNDFLYGESQGLQYISIPYKGNRFSMVVILPGYGKNAEVTESDFQNLPPMQMQTVEIYLPRFSVESAIPLDDFSTSLGLYGLDYSGLTSAPVEQIQAVSKVIFKTNEDGSEGGAGTAVAGVKSLPNKSQIYPVFRADRPFYYAVVDKETGTVLFQGRMDDPTKN